MTVRSVSLNVVFARTLVKTARCSHRRAGDRLESISYVRNVMIYVSKSSIGSCDRQKRSLQNEKLSLCLTYLDLNLHLTFAGDQY